jgi:hypothetical protein
VAAWLSSGYLGSYTRQIKFWLLAPGPGGRSEQAARQRPAGRRSEVSGKNQVVPPRDPCATSQNKKQPFLRNLGAQRRHLPNKALARKTKNVGPSRESTAYKDFKSAFEIFVAQVSRE